METIYTDEMIEACARACHEAHSLVARSAPSLGMSPLGRGVPWLDLDEDWREVRRADVRRVLRGLMAECDTCQDITLAVARAMGWPRKP